MLLILAQLIPDVQFNGDIGLESVENSMGSFLAAGIEKMAVVVGVAVGGWFAFTMVRKGLRWAAAALSEFIPERDGFVRVATQEELDRMERRYL